MFCKHKCQSVPVFQGSSAKTNVYLTNKSTFSNKVSAQSVIPEV